MTLTLRQAADRLGKSMRQVRYMIEQGKLPASKVGGRWMIESDQLPLSEGQQEAEHRRQHKMRAAVEDALEVREEEGKPKFSVRKLKAIGIAVPLYQHTIKALSEEHDASRSLRRAIGLIVRGAHRFDRAGKLEAYRAARDEASEALCGLILLERDDTKELVETIEHELMPALVGLLRRAERRRH